jgi:hypothetical protein
MIVDRDHHMKCHGMTGYIAKTCRARVLRRRFSNELIMKKNIGRLDHIIHFALVELIAVLYFAVVISGTWAVILGVVALVFS